MPVSPTPVPIDVTLTGVPPCRHADYTPGCVFCGTWHPLTPEERRGVEVYYQNHAPDFYRPGTSDLPATLTRIESKSAPASWGQPIGHTGAWAKMIAELSSPTPAAETPEGAARPRKAGCGGCQKKMEAKTSGFKKHDPKTPQS